MPTAKVQGLGYRTLLEREDKFVAMVRSALDRVAATVARGLGRGSLIAAAEPAQERVVSVDDLNATRSEWLQEVDGSLLPYVSELYTDSALYVVLGVRDATPPGLVVPPVRDEIAESYLANRRNFLAGIGDDLWTEMREGLLDGFVNGESIPELAARVRQSAGFTMGRAEAVARTEVVGASNAGSLDQVRATGLPAKKSWLATEDTRTRETHHRADGQTVDLDAKFQVGGWAMDRPHDPNAPPEEVVRCRCTLTFDVDVSGPFEDTPLQVVPEPQSFAERDWKDLRQEFGWTSDLPRGLTGDPVEQALGYFKGSSYKSINRLLRDIPGRRRLSDDEIRAEMANLDADFQHELQSPTLVWRGIEDGLASDLQVGSVLKDAGYASTTATRAFAEQWAGEGGRVMEIRLPQGQHCHLFGDDSFEHELLLPRDMTYRVAEVSGQRVVVEVLNA